MFEFDSEGGIISAGRRRVVLLSIPGLEAWWKRLSKVLSETSLCNIMYIAGIDYGVQAAEDYAAISKKSGKDLLQTYSDVIHQAGWGRVEFDFDEKSSTATWRLHNCFTAAMSGLSGCSGCVLLKGILAGFHKKAFDLPGVRSDETKCMNMGDAYCEFEVAPSLHE